MAKTTRSYGFEADDLAWLEAEAKRLDVSVSWLLRKLVREARANQARCAQDGEAA